MSVSYASSNRSSGPDVPIITALSTSPVALAPANPNRVEGGLIVNNANQTLYVSMTGSPATGSDPSISVPPNGGSLDIIGGYTGAIYGIWAAAGSGNCVVHQSSYV